MFAGFVGFTESSPCLAEASPSPNNDVNGKFFTSKPFEHYVSAAKLSPRRRMTIGRHKGRKLLQEALNKAWDSKKELQDQMFKLSIRAERDKQEISELKAKLCQSEKLESLLAEKSRNNDWLWQELTRARERETELLKELEAVKQQNARLNGRCDNQAHYIRDLEAVLDKVMSK